MMTEQAEITRSQWEEKEEGGEAQKHLDEYPAIDSKQRARQIASMYS
jgi:hypothetical protein